MSFGSLRRFGRLAKSRIRRTAGRSHRNWVAPRIRVISAKARGWERPEIEKVETQVDYPGTGDQRGSWPDMNWKGWWGDNPPYHVPTFILTHHARPPIQMEGGTTFYFVTGGIHEALDRARDAANGMDVRIGGGPNTIQQYLRTGLIDELHVAISPVLLGGGERLFEGIDVRALGYECVQFVASEKATHVVLRRQGHNDA